MFLFINIFLRRAKILSAAYIYSLLFHNKILILTIIITKILSI